MQSVDISTAAASTTSLPAQPLPMNGFWGTIRSYVFWQHERGTLHYDIMVTLILIFLFFSPRVINFNDKPVSSSLHQSDVIVTPDAQGMLVYQISASVVTPVDDASSRDQALRDQFMRIIKPISGDVTIMRYDAIADGKGHVQAYNVVAKR